MQNDDYIIPNHTEKSDNGSVESIAESTPTEADASAKATAEQKPAKKSYKGTIVGIIFLLLVTAATFIVIFQFNDLAETMRVMGSVDGIQMLFAALCMVVYIALWPISLCIFNKMKKTKATFSEAYLIGASEHFFNGVTPYQTGAQPFQVYSYARCGVKAGGATGLVLVNFITLLFASNILSFLSFIFAADLFGSFYVSGTLWIPIVGISMNLFTLFSFLILSTCRWVRNLLVKAMKLLCRIKFVGKFLSKQIPLFEEYCDNAQAASREILKNIKWFILAVLTKLIALACYYSVPYFIMTALGINVGMEVFFFSMMATAFSINAIVFIPTPGTSGGIEYAFTTVFAIFGMTSSVAVAGAIIWRGLTYYLLMLVSFIQYLILEANIRIRDKRAKVKQAAINDTAVAEDGK